MYRAAEDDVKPVTHWLALDLTRKSGVRLLQQALQYLVCHIVSLNIRLICTYGLVSRSFVLRIIC